MKKKVKRLFFAFKVEAPFYEKIYPARHLDKEDIHVTIVFIGNWPIEKYQEIKKNIPLSPFSFAPSAIGDKLLLLPFDNPSCMTMHLTLRDEEKKKLEDFRCILINYIASFDIQIELRPLLLHTTLARKPFDASIWLKHFKKVPILLTKFCLYESVGQLKYNILWEQNLMRPFEEVDHTAGIAFAIYGHCIQDLYINAQMALSFLNPDFTQFINYKKIDSLEKIIHELNKTISLVNIEQRCPIKAISMHGNIEKTEKNLLKWLMIADI
jgi:2'-5' RNA ligase